MAKKFYAVSEDSFIYEVSFDRELSSREHCLSYNVEMIAGYDYINPDENDLQGYVTPDRFNHNGISALTLFPLSETLTERLADEGLRVIENISEYKIYYKGFIVIKINPQLGSYKAYRPFAYEEQYVASEYSMDDMVETLNKMYGEEF